MKLLRDKQVAVKLACSKSHVWALARDAAFPKPIKISPGITAWSEEDIDAWLLTIKHGENHEAQRSAG